MLKFRVNLLLLLGVWVSLASGCYPSWMAAEIQAAITQELAEIEPAQTSTKLETDTTTTTPLTCESCYSRTAPGVCDRVSLVAETADDLARSLKSELRHQLRILTQSTSVCNIEKSTWTDRSEALLEKLKGSEGPSCHLKLPSEGATCAAVVKLMECAFTHMRTAYTNTRYCLSSSNHSGWFAIQQQLDALGRMLDRLYDTVLSDRKSQWSSVTSSISGLHWTLLRIFMELSLSTPCREGDVCGVSRPGFGSIHNDYLTQEDDFDETWYTMTAEDE